MSRSPISLRVLAASTAVALAAAIGTYALLSGGDDDGGTDSTVPTVELVPADEAAGGEAAFTTFEGDVVALGSLRGTPLLVNFFASNCTPCIKEMPALEEVHQALGDQVRFLGLAAAYDRADDALDLVERTGVTYDTARDPDSAVWNALGGTVLPTTVLLDADGEVVATHHGEATAGELRSMIADELGITAPEA